MHGGRGVCQWCARSSPVETRQNPRPRTTTTTTATINSNNNDIDNVGGRSICTDIVGGGEGSYKNPSAEKQLGKVITEGRWSAVRNGCSDARSSVRNIVRHFSNGREPPRRRCPRVSRSYRRSSSISATITVTSSLPSVRTTFVAAANPLPPATD